MRYGSVCSGIEAASVAWDPLGWQCAFVSEIEPFASAVLAHHWPDTPNLGDFTTIGSEHAGIDLLVGGTPCQAFSVAGLRGGMDDDRVAIWPSSIADWLNASAPAGSFGRTSPVSCRREKGGTLAPSSGHWKNSGMGGPTERWTLSTTVWHSGASVCSLSDVLEERGSVPQRYYLTPRACAGILRRAERRGRRLPVPLLAALQAVATGSTGKQTER